MDTAEAEEWIVDLMQVAKLDAKIDSEEVRQRDAMRGSLIDWCVFAANHHHGQPIDIAIPTSVREDAQPGIQRVEAFGDSEEEVRHSERIGEALVTLD